jgi:hypothetical protein
MNMAIGQSISAELNVTKSAFRAAIVGGLLILFPVEF